MYMGKEFNCFSKWVTKIRALNLVRITPEKIFCVCNTSNNTRKK